MSSAQVSTEGKESDSLLAKSKGGLRVDDNSNSVAETPKDDSSSTLTIAVFAAINDACEYVPLILEVIKIVLFNAIFPAR